MDDEALGHIEFHRETVSRETNSPLHLIREKEMEISGRVLAAKREAEEIVAAARRRAVDTVSSAEEEAVTLGTRREDQVRAESDAESQRIVALAEQEAAQLEAAIAGRLDTAVDYIVRTVKRARTDA